MSEAAERSLTAVADGHHQYFAFVVILHSVVMLSAAFAWLTWLQARDDRRGRACGQIMRTAKRVALEAVAEHFKMQVWSDLDVHSGYIASTASDAKRARLSC